MRAIIVLLAGLLFISETTGAVPALRDQISLNGKWPVGGIVPQYEGIEGLDEVTFERDVEVPGMWTDRLVKLEFGAVNFIADVYIDGNAVMHHVGGWMPFSVDVTPHVNPGRTFRLKVTVKGPRHPPIVDERGNVAWPVGGWRNRGGIADDVWLRAYGPVHVTDAFIRTDVDQRRMSVDYTVHNADVSPRTVRLKGRVVRPASTTTEVHLASPAFTLDPGESRRVLVEAEIPAVELYWPDRPHLYHLESVLWAEENEIDRETRRFGFREISIRGNQFYWNGVRINLYGDYQVFGDRWYVDSSALHTPEAWPSTVDRIKAMNLRVLRWHHNPVPKYLLDVADEKGLLICDESANYARDFHKASNHPLYVENALKTIEPWIRANRNHPSIYLWNATNEMTHSFTGPILPELLVPIGDEIRRHDPTRPIGFDGDTGRSNAREFVSEVELTRNRIRNAELIDYHYPEGYNKEPVGSIYGWAHLVFPDRPTGSGELLHTRSPLAAAQTAVERNTWWLGIWLRGLRQTNWTNVKPACWWFTDSDLASPDPKQRQRTLNLRNALAPVAVFDRAYDDLGIAPYVTGTTPGGILPTVAAGARQRRTLVVFNDEFADREVTIEVLLASGVKTFAIGRTTLLVDLGNRREVLCDFDVPDIEGQTLSLILRTYKQRRLTFEETRSFDVSGRVGRPAPSVSIVFP